MSTKEFSIINEEGDVDYYKPLLLKSPNIASKADIVDNKYTISSVSLSVSNAEFQGEILTENLTDRMTLFINTRARCLVPGPACTRRDSGSVE